MKRIHTHIWLSAASSLRILPLLVNITFHVSLFNRMNLSTFQCRSLLVIGVVHICPLNITSHSHFYITRVKRHKNLSEYNSCQIGNILIFTCEPTLGQSRQFYGDLVLVCVYECVLFVCLVSFCLTLHSCTSV